MHAKHARQTVMIDAITWLFAVGAIITAFNFFITEASGIVIHHLIFGQMSVSEVISVSGWSIFFAGFFYALVVVKPDLLRRQREYRIMTLKLEAANNPAMFDSATGAYSRDYFERILGAYFREFKELDRNLCVFSIKIGCDTALYDYALSGAVAEVKTVLSDHDENAMIARIADNTLAIVSPFMERHESEAFESALYRVVSGSKHLPFMAKCDIDHANYPRYAKTADGTIRGILASLGIEQCEEPARIEVTLAKQVSG